MEQGNDYPGKQWQPIFDYMVDNFDVSLTLKEMEELINGVSTVIGYAALQAKCERHEKERHETRLAMRMLLKVFKNIEKSPEQEKFYRQADYIFKKHHSVTDVLRDNQKEDKQ